MKKLIFLFCSICLFITSTLWAAGLSGIIIAGGGGTFSSVPAAPTGVSATAGNTQNTVTWSASSGSTSCNLYWKSGSSMSGNCTGNGTKVSGVTSPDVIGSLTNGTTYYYMLTCQNAAGESACSSEVSGTPNVTVTIPGAPTSVAATAGNTQNTITWSAPSTGGTPTSYNLYWSTTDMGSTCSSGTKITGVTSPDVITSLTNGTTYYYMLTAVNATGEGACSAEVNATPATVAQDFSTYTKVGSGFTVVSSTSITFSSLSNTGTVYVYKDFGTGHFGVNFKQYVDVNMSPQSGTLPVVLLWTLSNTLGDETTTKNSATGDLCLAAENNEGLYLNEDASGSGYASSTHFAVTNGTTYYVSIVRNSSIGTYGTLYAYIYDTSAHRSAGDSTGLLSTLSVTLHANTTWQYLYAGQTWNGSYGGTSSGSIQNLTIIQ